MVSPWPPRTNAVTSSIETFISSARKKRKRELSRTPAMPMTRWVGRPENFCSAQTIASSGLVMQMTKASGAYFARPAPTCSITLRLISRRSSRLMPGLRGTPAVTITTSAPAMSLYSDVPLMLASKPSTEEDWLRSSDLPCGTPSTMSKRTMSPSSLSPIRCARVPPICPAPMRAIFLRAMSFARPADVVENRAPLSLGGGAVQVSRWHLRRR